MPDEYEHLRESADADDLASALQPAHDAWHPGCSGRCEIMRFVRSLPAVSEPLQAGFASVDLAVHGDELERIGFKRIPGLIQSVFAVYIPGKGYLESRRGIIYGGRHGDAPFLDDPQKAIEIVERETRMAIRALASAHKRAGG